jgi:uncharacterized RDD family membrane protein YckC
MHSFKVAGFWARFCALVVDTFMILMPLGFVIHLTIGYDKRALIAWVLQTAIFGAITVLCWTRKGYTPGKKYMRLLVLDSRADKTLSVAQAARRFICQCLSMLTVIGVLLPVFRKDKKTLHDLLSFSRVVRL